MAGGVAAGTVLVGGLLVESVPIVLVGLVIAAVLTAVRPVVGLALLALVAAGNELEDVGLAVQPSWVLGILTGAGLIVRAWYRQEGIRGGMSVLPVALLLLASVWSGAISGSPVMGFLSWTMVVLSFVLAFHVLDECSDVGLLVGAMIVAGVLLGAMGVYAYLFDSALPLLEEMVGPPRGALLPRLAGFTSGPNNFATLYTLIFPLTLALFVNEDRPLMRLGYGSMCLLFGAAVILTFSRSAWVGLAVGFAAVLTAGVRQRRLGARKLGARVGSLLAIILFGVLVLVSVVEVSWSEIGGAVSQRVVTIFTGEKGGGRLDLYTAGLHMVVENPGGIGYGDFAAEIASYGGPRGKVAHNSFLNVGAQAGWMGFIALVWLLVRHVQGAVWYSFVKRGPTAVIGSGLVGGCLAFWIRTSFNDYLHWTVVWVYFAAVEIWLIKSGYYEKRLARVGSGEESGADG